MLFLGLCTAAAACSGAGGSSQVSSSNSGSDSPPDKGGASEVNRECCASDLPDVAELPEWSDTNDGAADLRLDAHDITDVGTDLTEDQASLDGPETTTDFTPEGLCETTDASVQPPPDLCLNMDCWEEQVDVGPESTGDLAWDSDAGQQCSNLDFELLCVFKDPEIGQQWPECPPGIQDPFTYSGPIDTYEKLEAFVLCGYCGPGILDYFGQGAIVAQALAMENSALAYCCPTAYQYCPGQGAWTFVVWGQCAYEFLGEPEKSFTSFLLFLPSFPENQTPQIAMYETEGNVEFKAPDRTPYFDLKAKCESLACCNP